jgi:uncharacterized protein YcfJ
MAMRRIESRLVGAVAVACVLAGCGTQSSPPPSNAAATDPPAQQPAAPAPQQNASLEELLAPSAQTQAPANVAAAAPLAGAAAPAEVAAPANAADTASAAAPAAQVAPADAAPYALVVSVTRLAGPQQICTDQTVVEKRKPKDENRVAGTVIGALAGGVIGNQFGGGHGRTVATVGGAVAGGAIGRKVQGDHQDKDTVTHVVKHCRPVKKGEEGATLYDVVYAYQGQNFHVRLDHDPGDRIELPVHGVE